MADLSTKVWSPNCFRTIQSSKQGLKGETIISRQSAPISVSAIAFFLNIVMSRENEKHDSIEPIRRRSCRESLIEYLFNSTFIESVARKEQTRGVPITVNTDF
ncbi:hypothetical protein TNIN_8871 [Trichonephila inaurata madagascariensis]|uniref:Uncharacterized protein n=1 Tax=Trichonephila inaurata madagascariensis TaxID=2747483 RepID=A0A8X6KEY4_9ARAC|nr:hypothetical protein TNIN_8871 [Trichonephila inaurata madagascariensis]